MDWAMHITWTRRYTHDAVCAWEKGKEGAVEEAFFPLTNRGLWAGGSAWILANLHTFADYSVILQSANHVVMHSTYLVAQPRFLFGVILQRKTNLKSLSSERRFTFICHLYQNGLCVCFMSYLCL
jgi:hypothetical protein